MNHVTRILNDIEQGNASAADELFPLIYQELRRLAAAKLSDEKRGVTWQPTVLVHEAYVRLVDKTHVQKWNSRGHFFSAAAESMRRILIENARRQKSQKHGGNFQRVELDDLKLSFDKDVVDLLALDEVLTQFEQEWPDKAQVVKLRYFAGLTIPETSKVLGISHATTERYWTFARTWLYTKLQGE